jgi:5-methylcytosine-specific restriction endonuclease McrA
MAIRSKLRRLAIERAKGSCEYCGLSQVGQEATFHIDHIVPISAGGPTEPENLALACVSCSLRKGARETAIDPHLDSPLGLETLARQIGVTLHTLEMAF